MVLHFMKRAFNLMAMRRFRLTLTVLFIICIVVAIYQEGKRSAMTGNHSPNLDEKIVLQQNDVKHHNLQISGSYSEGSTPPGETVTQGIHEKSTTSEHVAVRNVKSNRFNPEIRNNLMTMDVYKDRRDHLQNGCNTYNSSVALDFTRYPIKKREDIFVNINYSVVYCGIPKVGTKFWRRIFGIMGASDTYASPFEIKRTTLDVTKLHILRELLNVDARNEFLENVLSFVFVRDPYSRLYSGYENKLYNANPSFWNSYGREIAKRIRNNASDISLKYGHDISFYELVQYILFLNENDHGIDPHFRPMHTRCDPCTVPFHVVGKLETFKQDAENLFSAFKKIKDNFKIVFGDFEKETALDTATEMFKMLFIFKQHAHDLWADYPFYNLLIRTWNGLQIRGYLSKTIPLPFSASEAETVRVASMINAFQRALTVPVNKTAVKQQREEAMIQAYRTIPLSDMERLRQYVLKDCLLFDYDDKPAKLFDRRQETSVKGQEYLYMDGL